MNIIDHCLLKIGVYYGMGDYRKAIETATMIMNNSLKDDKIHEEGRKYKGMAYHLSKDYDAAIIEYTTVIANWKKQFGNEPNHAYELKGNCYFEMGNYFQAL